MSEMLRCEACGANVATLRRGRCAICYLRWSESRPVGLSAACVVCGERRREQLRVVEWQSSWPVMCHGCAGRAFRLSPMPRTVIGLRQKLARDRRWGDRRAERPDGRLLPKERRMDQRRAEPLDLSSDVVVDTDWIDADELVVEVLDLEIPAGEPTRIVALEEHR